MSVSVRVFICPRCKKRFRVRNPVSGRVYRCTACQERLSETDDSSGVGELDSAHTSLRAGPGTPGTPAPETRRFSGTTTAPGPGAG
ncbi:MAG: hypothetical protein HY720_07420, partial [Planctomycetes bacterium]|nr:hypothetical protein [Planctomycetota bacterium]